MKHTPTINEIVNEVQTKQQDECIRDAAPELLDALEELVSEFDRDNDDYKRGIVKDTGGIVLARAAIAKAKGEA